MNRNPIPTPTLLSPVAAVALATATACAALLGTAAPLAAQAPSIDAIEYPPLPALEAPVPTRVVLDNGLVVLLVEDHELPLVDAVALVRTGERLEDPEALGVADVTARVMRSGGTESLAADALDDWLEGKAASIESAATTVSAQVRMSSLAEDFEEVLGVFADVLRRPAFAEDRIEVERGRLASGISRQNDNPQAILFREIAEIVYGGDSPYANNPTYAMTAAIDREDLIVWHQRWYRPDHIILGLAGDFEVEQAVAAVRKAFGDWSRGPQMDTPAAGWREDSTPGIYYVEKNDVTQSSIAMAHLGIRKDHPDIFAVEVMNDVLSGGASARLFSSIRTQKGLAYGVSGGVGSNFDYPGLTMLWMTTKTETTAAGIEALLEEADRMTSSPPTSAEVEKAKQAILNSFIFNFDSTGDVLTQRLTYEYFGYPADQMERYRRGIEAVTVEDVRRAAAEHLHPSQFAILVVGPAEGLDKPLSTFGDVVAVDIAIPEPPEPEVEMTADGEARGAELLARALHGLGGAAAVDAAGTVRAAGTASQVTPQGEMEVGLEVVYRFPDTVRQEIVLPFGQMTMVVSPDTAFAVTPQGTLDLPTARADSLRRALLRVPLMALKQRSDDDFSVGAVGEGTVDNTDIEYLLVENGDLRTTFGVDPVSGRIVSAAYRGEGPSGEPGDVREVYSDFRPAGDLMLPHATDRTFGGEPIASSRLESIEINPELDGTAFERPVDGE